MPPSQTAARERPQRGAVLPALLVLGGALALLSWALRPALAHYHKRQQFQAISQFAVPIQGAIVRCLAITHDRRACDRLEKLIPHGYRPVELALAPLIDEIVLEGDEAGFTVSLYPAAQPEQAPFLDDTLDYVTRAAIEQRDGRPEIAQWRLDPQAGCAMAGYC